MIDSKELTVCLVIHNEAKIVPRCLESISRISSNIFVVHDGECTDTSLEICKQFRCKIVVRPHYGEAELHRAWQYSQVQTKWILQLDADEYLSDELVKHIDELLRQNANGYTFIWPFWNGEEYTTQSWPRKMALFQTKKAKFVAAPHEAAIVPQPIVNTPYRLDHKPTYDNYSWHTFKTKWIRWARIHAKVYVSKVRPQTYGYETDAKVRVHYYSIMQHPLLAILIVPLWHFAGNLWYGALREGYMGLKSSVFMSTYYGLVAWYVFWMRIHHVPSQ